jgi:hypothetical protein
MTEAEKCHRALHNIENLNEVLGHAQKASQRKESFTAPESGELRQAVFYFADGSTLTIHVYGSKWDLSITASKPLNKQC